jgi:uncharacterized protein YjbI with pentapeptide repeats
VDFGAGPSFEETTFKSNVSFYGAMLQDGASFQRASFRAEANFDQATFGGEAEFDGARFQGDASFAGVCFREEAGFAETTFERSALFVPGWGGDEPNAVRFEDDARFEGACFKGPARFNRATLWGPANFVDVTFEHEARFDGVTFHTDAQFGGSSFENARDFGPILALATLDLRDTVFVKPVRIEASARALCCRRTQFRSGADLLIRWAHTALEETDFAAPSRLAPLREPVIGEEQLLGNDESVTDPTPKVVSLRHSRVANLTIAGGDLQACRFEDAYGLDQLRLERARFAETPYGWQRWTRRRLPLRWTRRQAIVEEHEWRAQQPGATGWYGPELRTTSGSDRLSRSPEQITAIYRALRKGREDSKDVPGAADFYYGEMEMRRQGQAGLAARPHTAAHGGAAETGDAQRDGDRARPPRRAVAPMALLAGLRLWTAG